MKLLTIGLLLLTGCASAPQQMKMSATLMEWTRPATSQAQSSSPKDITSSYSGTTKSGPLNVVLDPETAKVLTSGAVDLGHAVSIIAMAVQNSWNPLAVILGLPVRSIEKVADTQIEARRDVAIVSAGTETLKLNQPANGYNLELGWSDSHPTLKVSK